MNKIVIYNDHKILKKTDNQNSNLGDFNNKKSQKDSKKIQLAKALRRNLQRRKNNDNLKSI